MELNFLSNFPRKPVNEFMIPKVGVWFKVCRLTSSYGKLGRYFCASSSAK